MHSMIIQLENTPITTEKLLKEFDLHDNFVGEIADYVNENIDTNEYKKWFKSCVENLGTFDENFSVFTLNKKGITCYFKEKYKKFKQFCDSVDFDKYMSDNIANEVKQMAEVSFSIYIYTDNMYMSLDSFLRMSINEETYFIGNILDYHI